jgi:hypothetical protein
MKRKGVDIDAEKGHEINESAGGMSYGVDLSIDEKEPMERIGHIAQT